MNEVLKDQLNQNADMIKQLLTTMNAEELHNLIRRFMGTDYPLVSSFKVVQNPEP